MEEFGPRGERTSPCVALDPPLDPSPKIIGGHPVPDAEKEEYHHCPPPRPPPCKS